MDAHNIIAILLMLAVFVVICSIPLAMTLLGIITLVLESWGLIPPKWFIHSQNRLNKFLEW